MQQDDVYKPTATQLALERQFYETRTTDVKCRRCKMRDLDAATTSETSHDSWVLGWVADVRQNVQCPLCRFFWKKAERIWEEKQKHVAKWRGIQIGFSPPDHQFLNLDHFYVGWERHDMEALPNNSAASTQKWPERKLFGRFLHPQYVDMDLVKSWLGRCNDQHDCWQGPKGSLETDTQDFISLTYVDVERRLLVRPQQKVLYAALSYVWGHPPPEYPTVCRPSAAQSDARILPVQPFNLLNKTLPRTLEDAIHFTQNLGIRYIWIDALCVPQSDEAEKMKQIQQMDRIYREAYCTIIAASGLNSNAGLPGSSSVSPRDTVQNVEAPFEDRDILLFDNLQVASNAMDGTPWQASYWNGHRNGILRYALEGTLWQSRAWTLQEGVLSSRRIIFTEKQVYFACDQASESESVFSTQFDSRPQSASAAESIALFPISRNGRMWSFAKLYVPYVEDLTKRNMSYASDALNVVRGMLNNLTSLYVNEAKFLCALPIGDFGAALLWEPVRYPDHRRPVPKGWDPISWPSWTWLGKNVEISYSRSCTKNGISNYLASPIFEIEDATGPVHSLQQHHEDSRGPDASGHSHFEALLRITASTIKIDLRDWHVRDENRNVFEYLLGQSDGAKTPWFIIDHELRSLSEPWHREVDLLHLIAVAQDYFDHIAMPTDMILLKPSGTAKYDEYDDRELYRMIPLLLVRTRDGVSRRAGFGLVQLGRFIAQSPEVMTFVLK